jgi:hypothetical protein
MNVSNNVSSTAAAVILVLAVASSSVGWAQPTNPQDDSMNVVGAAHPPQGGTVSGFPSACLIGRWDGYTGGYADVWGDGDYAYIPNYGLGDGNLGRVHVIDISDPGNPVLDETLFIAPPNNNASPQDVKVGDGLLFVALEGDGDDSVAIYDVRNPANRQLVATVRVSGFEFLHNLFYDSKFLYLPGGPTGNSIAIVDLTLFDPDNPPPSPITSAKWIVNDVGASFVHDVTVRNGRLYASAWDSLQIYDVSNVATTMPTFLGSVPGSASHSSWPTDDGNFVVTGEERTGGGIKVYRITDNGGSLSLTLTDSLVLGGAFSVHNQVIVGNRLYNSWYQRGLQVFDINPTTGLLEFVAELDTASDWGVYPLPGEDRILLSDQRDGLLVVALGELCMCSPLSRPVTPTVVNEVTLNGNQSTATVGESIKNRFISVTGGDPGKSQAVRVRVVRLPATYDVWNGTELWVDNVFEVCENSGTPGGPPCPPGGAPGLPKDTFWAATLSCDWNDALFMDWTTLDLPVHIYNEVIIPSNRADGKDEDAVYEVAFVNESCNLKDNASYSNPPLTVIQPKWGDTLKDCAKDPCGAPQGVTNIGDVTGVLDKFRNLNGAPIKARCDLVGIPPTDGELDQNVSILDVTADLSAFVGGKYEFAITDPCDGR